MLLLQTTLKSCAEQVGPVAIVAAVAPRFLFLLNFSEGAVEGHPNSTFLGHLDFDLCPTV